MILLSLLCLVSFAAWSAEGLIEKTSVHSVDVTVERIQTVLSKKGIRVFAVVDHRANAEGAGLELGEEQVIIFGNPRLGTPLMASQPTVGIDLPMKILVWKAEDGSVRLAYNDPAYLAARHGIQNRDAVLAKMSAALNKMTDAATAP